MEQRFLDRRDTDFVRDNMLINYCFGDNEKLLIESFMHNNHVDIRFDPAHYYLMITGIHNKYVPEHTKETFSNGVSRMLKRYEEVQKILTESGYTGNVFLTKENNSKQMGILFSPAENTVCTPTEIAEKVDRLYRTTSAFGLQWISTSLAGPYSGYDQAHQAFLEARELNDLIFFGLRDCVITRQLRNRLAKPCDVTAIVANVNALTHGVCCSTLKHALKHAEYLIDTLIRPSYSAICFAAMFALVDNLWSMLETVYPERISIQRIEMGQFASLEAYKHYLYNTLEKIFGQLKGVRRYSPTILLALSFINRSYQHPLSLTQVAEYVYTNASTLSSDFNAEVGMTLPEYVSKLRLAHACRMLTQTDATIENIAQETGFTSTKYFREVFKKQQGISARQYRELYGHKD